MSSKDPQAEPGLKSHVRVYLGLLALPIVGSLGFATPFFEQSRLFDERGWWRSLTLPEQIFFALLGWVIWAVAVTIVCLVLSLFFRRWREKIWNPAGRLLRRGFSLLGLLLVSEKDLDQLVDGKIQSRAKREADAGPPRGRRSGVAGVIIYGKLRTTSDLYTHSLSVEWISTGLPIGELVPSLGNTWEVHYGHLEKGGIQPQFVVDAVLGRVKTQWEGVEMLRVRDLRESQDLNGSNPTNR